MLLLALLPVVSLRGWQGLSGIFSLFEKLLGLSEPTLDSVVHNETPCLRVKEE